MYGLGDTKSVHVRIWLWLVLLARLYLAGASLRCYSSEQDRSVECDDDDAVCFTVCNRNITIQGCSWGSCEALVSMFPHISDCLHCKEDNCNIAPCLDGRLFTQNIEKLNKQYFREKNSTKYKLMWPERIRWITEKVVTIRDKIPDIRYTHHWTKSKETTTENPQTTLGGHEEDPSTSTERPFVNNVTFAIAMQNGTQLPNRSHSVIDGREEVKMRSGSGLLGNISKLEKILTLLLLLTLFLICLLSISWLYLCNWNCKCCELPPCDEKLPDTCEKRENVVEDNLYLDCGNCGAGKNVDRIQIKIEDADDCRTKNQSRTRDHRSSKRRDRSKVCEDISKQIDATCKSIAKLVGDKIRDPRIFGTENKSVKKHQNRRHCSPEVYRYSSATQDTVSFSTDSSCLQINVVSEKSVLPGNSELIQHKVLSKLPIASSVRFLLVPGYYIQGLSMTALQALASRSLGTRDKASISGRGMILGSGAGSRQRRYERDRNYTLDSMQSSEELEVKYMLSTTEIDAVLGHTADLPCDISIRGEDRVYMVLWFRQNAGKPLYRYDVRGRNIENAIHWSDNEGFAERARFNGKTKPAHLHLEGVQLTDEGIYRCRVDFKNTPTKNYQVNLSVIVPPYAMSVYNRQGEVKDSVIGPLEEGTGLTLSCEVRGGKPSPTVSWFINNRIVEGRLKTEHNLVVNTLEISSVQRENLNDTFKCQAGNTKLILPAEKSLRLELTLKPQSVQIVNKPIRLVANQEYTFICHVAGSRPSPQVTWWSDTKSFNRGKMEELSNETLVVSKLKFVPTPEDDDRGLKCRGENPVLKDTSLEDTVSLNVVYPPMVTLRLGPKLKPNAIKEGDDVYFECKVRANPKEHKISWYHNGVPVKRNSSSGVILSTESLVLQRVSRHNTGRYTCQAVNERGETTSQPVSLRVQFAPVCKGAEPSIVGASINEAVRVKCHVSSDPRDVTFTWKFNNNGEDFHVNPSKYSEPNSSSSDLMYTPLSERDYGTLACWGRNAIGQQTEPCTFQVVPAVRPGPLKNCTLRSTVNETGDFLEILCLPGYDGGLPQIFHLEALEAPSHKLVANLTARHQPLFRLELGTPPARASPPLQLVLYASNMKGKSEVLLLEDIAQRDPEKRTEWVTGDVASGLGSTHSLIISACIIIIVISIVLLAYFLIALRKRNASSTSDGGELIKTQLSHANGGGMLDERYIVSYQLKTGGGGDKQPDILSRVSDDPLERDIAMSQCEYNSNSGVIASFMSPCATPLEGFGLEGALSSSRPQTLAYSPSSSSTPLLNGNGTLRKSHHVLANNIPGPESCV